MRPAWATDDELARLTAIVARALIPSGREGAAVLLYRLFQVVPAPSAEDGADRLEIYIDELEGYPGDVLARAVSGVIRRWRWRSAPMVGDIAGPAEADPEYRQRLVWRAQLRILRVKPVDRALPPPAREQAALEVARRYAMLKASDEHRGAPWPARAAAIVAAFESAKSPAE